METIREPAGPGAVVERLCQVTNEHDLQGVGACFAIDYRLEMPTHPDRDFVGREQVLRNWGQIFAGVPDIAVDARWVTHGDTAWSEWEMRGTRRDGSPHLMRGVIIFQVRDGEFSSARFYVEPVEQESIGIDEVIRQTVRLGAVPMASDPATTAPSAGSEGTGR
jgi:ketosteroid isomerase-like protein